MFSQIRSVALRNALPTTTSSRTWDRDYTSGSSLYSSRSSLGDKLSSDKSESRNGSSYAAGGYRASNVSKSPARDSFYDRKASTAVEGQCGLVNIGNTCFMNSVLQCLSQTNDLSKFVRSSAAATATVDKGSSSSDKDQKIWKEFCKLITQMWQSGARNVNPSELKMALSSKYKVYSGSAQQDAQEFLRYLLDALHGACNIGGQKVSLHIDDTMRWKKKNKIYRLNNSYRIFFMKLQRPGESERDVGLVYEAREFRHQRSVRRATQKLASLHILREDERHL